MVLLSLKSKSKTKHLLSLTSHRDTVKGRHVFSNVPAPSTSSLLQGLHHSSLNNVSSITKRFSQFYSSSQTLYARDTFLNSDQLTSHYLPLGLFIEDRFQWIYRTLENQISKFNLPSQNYSLHPFPAHTINIKYFLAVLRENSAINTYNYFFYQKKKKRTFLHCGT